MKAFKSWHVTTFLKISWFNIHWVPMHLWYWLCFFHGVKYWRQQLTLENQKIYYSTYNGYGNTTSKRYLKLLHGTQGIPDVTANFNCGVSIADIECWIDYSNKGNNIYSNNSANIQTRWFPKKHLNNLSANNGKHNYLGTSALIIRSWF